MPMTPTLADLAGLKARQHAAWSAGDYAVVGSTLQIVGEQLCEALDLRPGERVLDVAAGNGNVSLAAARRWCAVTSTDFVPTLLARGQARAEADGLNIAFREADAEALPFADGSFDAVVSTYGVVFTLEQEKAAAEMLRVCRPGGKIGLANWTPQGFVGQMFKALGQYLPPPAGANRRRYGALRTSDGIVWRRRQVDPCRVAQFRVPLPLACALHRCVHDLLRTDSEGPGGARKRAAPFPGCRSRGADRPPQPRRRRCHGRAGRISRGCDRQKLTGRPSIAIHGIGNSWRDRLLRLGNRRTYSIYARRPFSWPVTRRRSKPLVDAWRRTAVS